MSGDTVHRKSGELAACFPSEMRHCAGNNTGFYNINLIVIMLNSVSFSEFLQESCGHFEMLRVLGKEKSWNFHIHRKPAPSQMIKKNQDSIHKRESR